jgi:hypothetical protein
VKWRIREKRAKQEAHLRLMTGVVEFLRMIRRLELLRRIIYSSWKRSGRVVCERWCRGDVTGVARRHRIRLLKSPIDRMWDRQVRVNIERAKVGGLGRGALDSSAGSETGRMGRSRRGGNA